MIQEKLSKYKKIYSMEQTVKKTIRKFYILIFLPIIGLTACFQAEATQQVVEPLVEGVVLEVVGLEETKSLTLAELQTMTPTEGWGGTVSSAGVITPPQQLKGVSLMSIADLVGGLEPGMGVSVVAKDGYGMTMSYEQIKNGDFITYDPGTGLENKAEGPLHVIVAYERDGELISANDDGPLRLFIVSPKNDNIVDGHWSVKWVTQIRLKPMSEEWSLYLEGALTEEMDRNSFESCSAPGCHQASWEDEDGNVWTGVPLYYLAGRVDDGIIHEDRAYNDEFAKAGYILELFAEDGYNVSITSEQSDFNRHILVASSVNGEALGEKYFPMRLVGDDLEKSEMLGALAQIVIVPAEGVDMPSAEVPESIEEQIEFVLPKDAALMILGKVTNQLTLKIENLENMNVVEIQAEYPQKGTQTYRGIRLNDLLDFAGVETGTTELIVTASDGYQVSIGLADVQNCQDCLLAFDEEGMLNLVMVGMDSGFWVKDVNFLQVK